MKPVPVLHCRGAPMRSTYSARCPTEGDFVRSVLQEEVDLAVQDPAAVYMIPEATEFRYGEGGKKEYVALRQAIVRAKDGKVVVLEAHTTVEGARVRVDVTRWIYEQSSAGGPQLMDCNWEEPRKPCLGDPLFFPAAAGLEANAEANAGWEPVMMCMVPAPSQAGHGMMQKKTTLLFVRCTAHPEAPHEFCLARGKTGYCETGHAQEKDANVFCRVVV